MPDWSRYQACPVCPAVLGEACLDLSGRRPDGPVVVEARAPHTGRKLRAAAERGEASRG